MKAKSLEMCNIIVGFRIKMTARVVKPLDKHDLMC
jgi:hypothetical protein